MVEVSILSSQNTSPLTIQASRWFDLVTRAHEKQNVKLPEGSAPEAMSGLFLSLEACTVTTVSTSDVWHQLWSPPGSPPGLGRGASPTGQSLPIVKSPQLGI